MFVNADASLFILGLLWLAGKDREPARPPPSTQPPESFPPALPGGQQTSTPPAPPPWPQTVPAGLPSFPSGWEFDEPPPLAVQQRAKAILQSLWDQGSGTWKAEQTAGRWIVYRAEVVASGKKGVVAYRPKPAAKPVLSAARRQAPRVTSAPSSPSSVPSAAAPAPVPAAAVPAAARAPAAPAAAPAAPAPKLPELRRGMGSKASPNNDVKGLQRALGIAPVDGVFGTGTEAAVMVFQRKRGLKVDGIVGPATWGAIYEQRV